MLNIEELMEKLNGKGRVTDKQTAIELLMVSPKAWNLLSPELKKDEEVMLYYQPLRYIETEEGPTVGAAEIEEGGRLYDKEFEIDGTVSVCCCVCVSINSAMPKCVLKKSNSFKKAYMAVQERLDYKRVCSGSKVFSEGRKKFEELTENMHGIYGSTKHRYCGPTDGYIDDYTVYECDPETLPQIVEEEYQKYLSTKRR